MTSFSGLLNEYSGRYGSGPFWAIPFLPICLLSGDYQVYYQMIHQNEN
jgi:hypothetical protein